MLAAFASVAMTLTGCDMDIDDVVVQKESAKDTIYVWLAGEGCTLQVTEATGTTSGTPATYDTGAWDAGVTPYARVEAINQAGISLNEGDKGVFKFKQLAGGPSNWLTWALYFEDAKHQCGNILRADNYINPTGHWGGNGIWSSGATSPNNEFKNGYDVVSVGARLDPDSEVEIEIALTNGEIIVTQTIDGEVAQVSYSDRWANRI